MCSPTTEIRPSCSIPGLITTRSSVPAITPAPSAPRMRGFGTDGSPLRTQTSRWLRLAARCSTSTSPSPASGSGASSYRSTSGPPSSWMRIAFTAEDPTRLVVRTRHTRVTLPSRCLAPRTCPDGHAGLQGSCRFAGAFRGCFPTVPDAAGHTTRVTTEDVLRIGAELGLDAVGVARAEAYVETERHIVERRARGLFGSMRFTTARPDVSCHPETLLEGARAVVSAALCYWEPEPERPPGRARLARYTWGDRYADLRERLDALGRVLGGDYRVLVDANQHVDR